MTSVSTSPRYDIDGVHFDDYFYPYPDGTDFPDDSTYNDYINGGGSLPRDDWRRDNVNRMVESVYSAIRANSNTVKFSISPFGIYRPGHPEGMPPPIAGLDPYEAQYADSKYWLQQGWVDYFSPQLYWAIDPPAQSYPVLLDWWLANNPIGRHIYAANGVYKIDDSNNWPVSEITNQVDISREETRRALLSLGNVLYSARYFRDNTKGIFDTFRDVVYPTPAATPPMPWLGGGKTPKRPILAQADDVGITWYADEADDAVNTWGVYKLEGGKWKTLAILPKDVMNFLPDDLSPGLYAVQAISRVGITGEALQMTIP